MAIKEPINNSQSFQNHLYSKYVTIENGLL